GLACGVLRGKALIKMIVALQDDIDAVGDQKINPGFDALFRGMKLATEVRLVPVGDDTSIRMGSEVLLQPGGDIGDPAFGRPVTGIGKGDEVPGPLVE